MYIGICIVWVIKHRRKTNIYPTGQNYSLELINVHDIRDCQKSRKVKPTNIYSLRSYMPDNNTGAVLL